MTRLRVDGKKMRGYGKWLLAEYNESRGRAMVSWYIYVAPDDVARQMLRKGARRDDGEQYEGVAEAQGQGR